MGSNLNPSDFKAAWMPQCEMAKTCDLWLLNSTYWTAGTIKNSVYLSCSNPVEHAVANGRIWSVQTKTKCYCKGPNTEEKSGFVLSKANLPSYIYLYIQYIYVLRLTFLCSVLISCVLLCSTSVLTVFLYNLMLLIILHFVCRCATVSCFNIQVLT